MNDNTRTEHFRSVCLRAEKFCFVALALACGIYNTPVKADALPHPDVTNQEQRQINRDLNQDQRQINRDVNQTERQINRDVDESQRTDPNYTDINNRVNQFDHERGPRGR